MLEIIFALLFTNGFMATYIPRSTSTLIKIDTTYCTPGELAWLNDELGERGFHTMEHDLNTYINASERINVLLTQSN